jgi:hypothetical protein
MGRISGIDYCSTIIARGRKKREDMICPQCGAEYREGFTLCADCNVPLVPKATGIQQGFPVSDENAISEVEPESIDFVTVYRAGDPGFVVFGKSLLESEGVKYYAKREGLQDLFAGGRLGTGYNPVIGPVEIQVDQKDVEKARELLNQIEKGEFDLLETDAENKYAEQSEEGVANEGPFKDLLKGMIRRILNLTRPMQRD